FFREISPEIANRAVRSLSYIELKNGPAQRVMFDFFTMEIVGEPFHVDKIGDEKVCLALALANSLPDAREFYLNSNNLKSLITLKSEHLDRVELNADFNFKFRGTPLMYGDIDLPYTDYFTFWNKNLDKIKQMRRDSNGSFLYVFDEVLKAGLMSDKLLPQFMQVFENTGRNHINPCPQTNIRYCWTYDEAVRMDGEDELIEQVKAILPEILACWQQEIPPWVR
ncbi:MAG TPA: hypothetical protein PLV45_07685, partial [bacterium]|nr:hypothetical protein [bacterium]